MNINLRKLLANLSLSITLSMSTIVDSAIINGQGTWETTLQPRDLGGLAQFADAYYDTVLDITWIIDPNTSRRKFGVSGIENGSMSWDTTNEWIAAMNSVDGTGYFGFSDWRLPITTDVSNDGCSYTNRYQAVDCGYNLTVHSELSHMYSVTLGNQYFDTSGVYIGLPFNDGPFSSFPAFGSLVHWSSSDTGAAWFFNQNIGLQGDISDPTVFNHSAWAVHDGDIGIDCTGICTPVIPSVPIPAAIWLFSSGLLGLIGIAREKGRSNLV